MKKMIIGLVAGLMIGTAGTALAATTQPVQALFAKFNLQIEGKELVEIEPLVYDGTSYLPVREVAELLGYDVDYEHSNRLITIQGVENMNGSEVQNKINETVASINEEFRVGNVSFKVNDISYSTLVPYQPGGDGAGFTPTQGEKFIIINFDVYTDLEPESKFSWSANEFLSHIVVQGKNLYGAGTTGESARINPGEKKTVEVFFSLPEDLDVSSVHFRDPKSFYDVGSVNIQ
ncbi:stalk domain-containing protein [Paenibacillus senegalensis]|uniref:stalk domain-containing protein n=1 Tax=Paenibacillus senegalensis TaxID=1465766 RepID=UPI000288F508|nr:stalk domain-containing protein [Paenibacillus senegalensis]